MTRKERAKYLKAYLRLTTEMPLRYRYEKYIYLHQKYFCYGIHTKNLFFPWHRYYILQMENLLRSIDCQITLPYWDWSYAGLNSSEVSELWSNESYGLGGNGDPDKGFCVQTGMFRESEWQTPFFNDNLDIVLSTLDIYGDIDLEEVQPELSDCLRRFFLGKLPNTLHVKRALNLPPEDFSDFDVNLRINYHDTVHNAIGKFKGIFTPTNYWGHFPLGPMHSVVVASKKHFLVPWVSSKKFSRRVIKLFYNYVNRKCGLSLAAVIDCSLLSTLVESDKGENIQILPSRMA